MIIYCFSSEDFKPKRLVYGTDQKKTPDTTDYGAFGLEPPAPEAEAEPSKPSIRQQIWHVSEQVENDVYGRYREKEVAVKDFLTSRKDYKKTGGWRQWNKEFADKMGGMDKVQVRQQVRAMQQVVFRWLKKEGKLEQNDPAAVIDGKLGPYTLAALALYAKLPKKHIKVPSSDKNTGLAQMVKNYAEPGVEGVELMESGRALIEGIGDAEPQDDGTYLIKTGERETYFRFHNGKWQWASKTEKERGEAGWVDVGTGFYKEKGMEKVDKLSKQLASIPAPTVPKQKREAVRRLCESLGLSALVYEPRIFNELASRVGDKPGLTEVHSVLMAMRNKRISQKEYDAIYNVAPEKKTAKPETLPEPPEDTWKFTYQYKNVNDEMVPVTATGSGRNIEEAEQDALDKAYGIAAHNMESGELTPIGSPEFIAGLEGVTGTTGPTGPEGAYGPTGPQGLPGVEGPTGPTGVPGVEGPTGPTGVPGVEGPTGPIASVPPGPFGPEPPTSLG